MADTQEWYYNTVTGEVEQGPQSPMQNRLGPYKTREDAQKALEIAKKRNKKWDDQDRAWNSWNNDDSHK
ncbi:hypothetical protein [Bifidobacterium canis]|uniref:SPOR domain-containing protein n=1 Tax=Bifidobacterium canis TaxID=2610880 RepID=A0A7K1J302_9BIFI|nr:hypothetical protein [Bifidobacterium canis]MUH58930.1 hypothetical protein [Bifidobacterium canis]